MSSLAIRIAQYDRAREQARLASGGDRGPITLVDGKTREEVIATYARKVMFIARRIMHRLPSHAALELDDLINSGVLGLLDAVDKYDPTKNTKFGTYVEFRIRGAILDLLRGLDPVTRTVREKSNQLQKTTRALELRLGRPPEREEVASEMGLTMKQYHSLLDEVRSINLVSIDGPRSERDEGRGTLADVIEDVRADRPDSAMDKSEAITALADAIQNGLPDRLRDVLVMYYYREMNLKEIGAVLGVSESRVSQLHTEACLRLRGRLAPLLKPGETLDLSRRKPK